MPDPLNLSVYICTYNEQANIQPCIHSVQKNNIGRVFVVDGGSTDNTAQYAKDTDTSILTTSKGLAGQRQTAINHCTTPYLMFVDADDRLDHKCIARLLSEMNEYGYAAIQAQLQVQTPVSYWQKAMNATLSCCISIPGPTTMVGRPALYRTIIIKQAGADLSFNNIGNEDAALSIRIERMGEKQGIGTGRSYRLHPQTFTENIAAWKKYGLGDYNLIRQYPDKTFNVVKHLLFVYPVQRSWQLLKHGKGLYCGYTIGIGLTRFLFLLYGALRHLLFGKLT